MAAILAGSTHATLSCALILFEMTGSYGVILPLLAACVISRRAINRALTPESIYTAPLKRKGVELPRITRPAWMQRTGVASLVRIDAPQRRSRRRASIWRRCWWPRWRAWPRATTSSSSPTTASSSASSRSRCCATCSPISPICDLLVAADVMERTGTVSVDASLWEATRRALAAESTRMPVVSPRENNRFVGTLAIPDVLAAGSAARTR